MNSMERVVTLREFVRSLEPKLKQFGSYTVECIYTTTGKTGTVYYTFDLFNKSGKIAKINVKAIRG